MNGLRVFIGTIIVRHDLSYRNRAPSADAQKKPMGKIGRCTAPRGTAPRLPPCSTSKNRFFQVPISRWLIHDPKLRAKVSHEIGDC
jgi:hypothetical protein